MLSALWAHAKSSPNDSSLGNVIRNLDGACGKLWRCSLPQLYESVAGCHDRSKGKAGSAGKKGRRLFGVIGRIL
jgi:hypothetical protein